MAAKRLGLTRGQLFLVLVGRPHKNKWMAERIANMLDERPGVIQVVIDETKRLAQTDPDVLIEAPEHLSELRALDGLTQSALAERSDIAVMTISKIENGLVRAHAATVHALAHGLGLDPVVVRQACSVPELSKVTANE
jgi:DNA-binding XRE family transcriptional regulator